MILSQELLAIFKKCEQDYKKAHTPYNTYSSSYNSGGHLYYFP